MGDVLVESLVKLIYVDMGWGGAAAIAISHSFWPEEIVYTLGFLRRISLPTKGVFYFVIKLSDRLTGKTTLRPLGLIIGENVRVVLKRKQESTLNKCTELQKRLLLKYE